LSAEAEAPGAAQATRNWRAIAASTLTVSILFRDLEHHLGLDNVQDLDISTARVDEFFPKDNRLAALSFYNDEIRGPAERTDAPSGVIEERSLVAASMMFELLDDDLKGHLEFYHSELVAPLERSAATGLMRQARAHVAAVLLSKIKVAKGLDAALAFYETELQHPAEQVDAPTEVQEERGIVAAGLRNKGSATWLGMSLAVARGRAEFSLAAAINAERGLDDALSFYDTQLKRPAQQPFATNLVKEARAAAATSLLHSFVAADRFDDADKFYVEELQGPASVPNASADCQIWRAIAAMNLLADTDFDDIVDFYNHELKQPALQPNAPAALSEWRFKAVYNLLANVLESDELNLALRICFSELARPAKGRDGIGSDDARQVLERAASLFEGKADAMEESGFIGVAARLRAAARHFHSVAQSKAQRTTPA
jgi:hypothetical protein